MNEKNAMELCAALGTEGMPRTEEWLIASCPLAFERHKGGKDESPSFGIRLDETGKSGYNCYACHIKGRDLAGLLAEMHYYASVGKLPANVDLAKAYKIVEDENSMGYFGAEWEGPFVKAQEKFEAWPEWFIEGYPSALSHDNAMAYLRSRRLTDEHIKHFNVRYDPKRKMVGFPFRNGAGKLAGMRGRSTKVFDNFPHYDFKFNNVNNTRLVFLGEHEINWLRPVVVVEGEFDYASVYSVYPNVLANLTASLSYQKVRKLENAVEIIGMFDDDEAGVLASKTLEAHFKSSYRPVDWTLLDKYRSTPNDFDDPGKCNQFHVKELLAPLVSLA